MTDTTPKGPGKIKGHKFLRDCGGLWTEKPGPGTKSTGEQLKFSCSLGRVSHESNIERLHLKGGRSGPPPRPPGPAIKSSTRSTGVEGFTRLGGSIPVLLGWIWGITGPARGGGGDKI